MMDDAKHEGRKRFDGDGYVVWADPKSCFFCKYLTDIFYDYTNGPYMFFCDKATPETYPVDNGLQGKCDMFEEEDDG